MWKWLHPYAKPERAYQLAGTLLPWFAVISLLSFVIGTVWGLAFAPADYQQGDSFRIIYIHVPSAILSMGAYSTMAVAAFIGLVWQLRMADMTVAAIAPVGAVFTFIALFTGAAWGKPMWGTWWVWDARLTSVLVLFFLWLGHAALVRAFDDTERGARMGAILALIGVVNVPIVKFSVDWWNTLHQPATITVTGAPSMHVSMLVPLMVCVVGFSLGFAAIVTARLRAAVMERRIRGLLLARAQEAAG